MNLSQNTYDQFAEEQNRLISNVSNPDRDGVYLVYDMVLPRLLEFVGDISGLTVLDAGCGEGYVSRILAERGAIVTGIEVSPRLIEFARSKPVKGNIDYLVHDLSESLPRYENSFDLVVSNMPALLTDWSSWSSSTASEPTCSGSSKWSRLNSGSR